MVQCQIEVGHEFRDQVEDYFEICEQWADEELKRTSTQTAEAAKKVGVQASCQNEVRQEIERLIEPCSTQWINFEALETAARAF